MARLFLRSYSSVLRSYSRNFQLAKSGSSNPPNLGEEDYSYENLDSQQIFEAKWDLFESWMSEHNKCYSCQKEKVFRFFTFTANLDLLDQLRRANPRTRAHLTEHSDRTQQEVFAMGRAYAESLRRRTNSENTGGGSQDSEKD